MFRPIPHLFSYENKSEQTSNFMCGISVPMEGDSFGLGDGMKLANLTALLICLFCIAPGARADITVLLEEPYSYDGAFAGAGHTAVYLSGVCADSPTVLRRCVPGESGVVISRYTRIAGYDWIAIPLIPYLYAVTKPEDIPLYSDSKLVALLRDQYRRRYLEDIAPDERSGQMPGGDWVQLIGSSYDRTSYGFQIETTAAQDEKFIQWMNARPNARTYEVLARNCADFVRDVVNFYYPKAVTESIISDFGVATPKHAAKSLVKYSRRHQDLEFSSFVIPQVPGSMKRSKPVRGLVESVFKAKKYEVPLAILNPFVAGGVATAYLISGRFNPSKNALVFSPTGKPQPPLTAEERRSYEKEIDDLLRQNSEPPLEEKEISWHQFREKARPSLDLHGLPVLKAIFAGRTIELGISRENFLHSSATFELQREFLTARLRSELANRRTPSTSDAQLQDDWNLLRRAETAGDKQVRVVAQVNALSRGNQPTSH
jgi:hypothetical protein